jgi:transposase
MENQHYYLQRMKYRQGSISEENEVRFIDAFVDSLEMGKLGFKTKFTENGRPAYPPSDLLKLYIYGYLNPPGRTVSDLLGSWRRNALGT